MIKPLSILLLCDDNPRHAVTVLDHIGAFLKYSKHHVLVLNIRGVADLKCLNLNTFDVVIIHYSLMVIADSYFSPAIREKVNNFRGLKIQFIQDDYRQISKMTAMIKYLGINVLYTLCPEREIPKVWKLPGVKVLNTLAGYLPEWMPFLEPARLRQIDVVYRGREVPYWLGRLGQEKIGIGKGFLARSNGLKCDIAWKESNRIYAEKWRDFLCSAKTTLGTESGASITDFDGSLQVKTEAYLKEHTEVSFEEVHSALLAPYEGNVPMNIISPRMFEAIACRTGLVLFPGYYSGILKPDIHYIPLQKDFSNIGEVIVKIRDNIYLDKMTMHTYWDIVGNGLYSYRTFIEGVDDLIDKYEIEPCRGFAPTLWLVNCESRIRALPLRVFLAAGLERYSGIVKIAKRIKSAVRI